MDISIEKKTIENFEVLIYSIFIWLDHLKIWQNN